MKRFYCTVCRKVKRVRKYPTSVAMSTRTSVHPEERVGVCSRHEAYIHPQYRKVGR
jgi:hypothetical protein